jgi:DNA-binding transcriptional LysR family regulator
VERVETRELAYFRAVAEELHIGRAAARLGIAQPPLSRAVRQLERRLGVDLLVRHAGGVRLTPAGEVLAREAVTVLDAAEAAVRRTRRAAEREARLVVALKPGGDSDLLPEILAAYPDEPAAVPVDVKLYDQDQRAAALRDGSADVAFLHYPPEDLAGLDVEPLLVEPPLAVLPAGHRLADRQVISLADLADEPVARWRGRAAFYGDGPEVRDIGQLMQLITLGRAVAVMPDSARSMLRTGLVWIPVTDAQPVTLVLAWPEQSTSPALAAFVRVAARVAARRLPRPSALGKVDLVTTGSALGHTRVGHPASA